MINLSVCAFGAATSLTRGALAVRKAFSLRQRLPSVGATTTTAASGGNRESLLGQRPARRAQCAADAGCRNPALSSEARLRGFNIFYKEINNEKTSSRISAGGQHRSVDAGDAGIGCGQQHRRPVCHHAGCHGFRAVRRTGCSRDPRRICQNADSYSTYRESVSSQGAVGTLYTDLPGSSAWAPYVRIAVQQAG